MTTEFTPETLQSIYSKLGISKVLKGNKVLKEDGKKSDIDRHILAADSDILFEIPELKALLKEDGVTAKIVKENLIACLMEESLAAKNVVNRKPDWVKTEKYFAIHDVATNDLVVFHRAGGRAEVHPRVYSKLLGLDYVALEASTDVAYVKYCPDSTETLFMKESDAGIEVGEKKGQVLVANTYVAPYWQKLDIPAVAVMPPLFEKFFNHLFPIEVERMAVFNWIHFAMIGRAQTILCVPGIQGIGKTKLGEGVLKALFGSGNWNKAPRSFVSKEFNSFLEEKKIVLVEEIPTPRSREDRVAVNEMLKDITNDTVTIEGKGKDSRTVDNWANLIVTSNKLRSIPLETPTDRRFLCVSTSKNKLDTVMTNEEYTEFDNSLVPNSKEITEFAMWVLKHGRVPRATAHYSPQTDIKYQIYRMSLTMWEMKILKKMQEDRVKKEGIFAGEDLEAYVKKEHIKLSTIEEFLDVFQLPSGNSLGTWEKSGVFCLTEEAMKSNLYINPRYLQKGLFGDEDEKLITPEDEEAAAKEKGRSKKSPEIADDMFFMKHGMTKAQWSEKEQSKATARKETKPEEEIDDL